MGPFYPCETFGTDGSLILTTSIDQSTVFENSKLCGKEAAMMTSAASYR
jgi:hypothetical protein